LRVRRVNEYGYLAFSCDIFLKEEEALMTDKEEKKDKTSRVCGEHFHAMTCHHDNSMRNYIFAQRYLFSFLS